MRKVIAAINMTLDGFCNHDALSPDAEVHQHYTKLLENAGTILYGRITYQLMEDYWPALIEKPSGEKAMDDFAKAMQNIHKIVFSHTLAGTTWEQATLAKRSPEEEVQALRQLPGKDILVGSPGMIATLHKLHLIDEYQLCVHPLIAGSGLPLFKDMTERTVLRLAKTKTFTSGAVILYYERIP